MSRILTALSGLRRHPQDIRTNAGIQRGRSTGKVHCRDVSSPEQTPSADAIVEEGSPTIFPPPGGDLDEILDRLKTQMDLNQAPECFVKQFIETDYEKNDISELQASFVAGSTLRIRIL